MSDGKGSVIILGAGVPDGIGGALARKFASEGHYVVVTGRTKEKVETVAEAIRAGNGSADAMAVHISSAAIIASPTSPWGAR